MTRKIELLIILLLLIAIPLGISFFFANPKPKKETASPTKKPVEKIASGQTTLAFAPSPYTISSSSGSLNIIITAEEDMVTAAQLEITYDPKVLSNVAILPGTFFVNPLQLIKNVDRTKGKIVYAVGVSPTAAAQKGAGIVATITFTANLATGEKTDISFSPKTLVTAEGVRTSILKEVLGTTIIRQ